MFRTLDQADLRGKRVLVRVDLNVPVENGKVADSTRIERVAPTIGEIADKGGKVILLSHFGRPKGRDPTQSLKPLVPAIAQVLKRPVAFADDCVGAKAMAAIDAMKPGDILCLENTRFHAGEESGDPAFVDQLAALGDIFVNDAFSVSHRAHASVEGLGRKLPSYAGRTMQEELDALTKVLETPTRPVAAIVGTIFAPDVSGPYLPESFRVNKAETIDGEVVRKLREAERLLLTVQTTQFGTATTQSSLRNGILVCFAFPARLARLAMLPA